MKKLTYFKEAHNNYLSITLEDLGINKNNITYVDENDIDEGTFKKLVLLTPTNQSSLGDKFEKYNIHNQNLQQFVERLCTNMDVDGRFFFVNYTVKSAQKNNVFREVMKCNTNMIVLRIDSGLKESLYASVRNALAHGNVIRVGKHYALFSLAETEKKSNLFDAELTFFLRVSDLSKLDEYYILLKKHKKRDI